MTFSAWAVFLLATLYTIWDGVRRARGTRDLEGFFAASRRIPWWAAGLSVMATQLSAITIISGVGIGYTHGLEWVQFYFALPFAMVILCIWFVPAFRRHPILTAYEYLERRFGPVTRSLTSATFLLSRCLAFAVVLHAPAVVFSVMTGIPIEPTIVITGLLTTAYTVVGGISGVVWTDVKQMLVIVLGIFACLALLLWDVGRELGLGGIFTALGAAGRVNAVEVSNPAWTFTPIAAGGDASQSFWNDKYNVWTGLFGTVFLFLSYFGCDQSQVQSMLTARSTDASRRALLLSAFTKVPLQLLVLFLGGLLFLHHALGSEKLLFQPQDESAALALGDDAKARYDDAVERFGRAVRARAETMHAIAAGTADAATRATYREAVAEAVRARTDARAALHAPDDSNYVLPDFLFREVPKPLLGLMLAAIFAAAISSAAGALSSLTSATMIDFYRRWIRADPDERAALRTSRIAMACWGVAATAAAVGLGGGELLERVNEVGSWFYGSILGVFVLALAVPKAGGRAASAGLIAGLLTVFAVHNTMQVAFLWYNLIGCAGCVAVGVAVAALERLRAEGPPGSEIAG